MKLNRLVHQTKTHISNRFWILVVLVIIAGSFWLLIHKNPGTSFLEFLSRTLPAIYFYPLSKFLPALLALAIILLFTPILALYTDIKKLAAVSGRNFEFPAFLGHNPKNISRQFNSLRKANVRSVKGAGNVSQIFNTSFGLIILSEWNIIFVNKKFCSLTGFSVADVIGKHFKEFIVTEQQFIFRKFLDEYTQPYSESGQFKLINPLNRDLICKIHKKESDEGVDLMTVTVEAVESEKEDNTTHSLRDELLLEKVPVVLWTFDANEGINFKNAPEFISPYLLSNPIRLVYKVQNPGRASLINAIRNYPETPIDEEICISLEPGSMQWFRIRMMPVEDSNDKTVSHLGFAYDITPQKSIQDQLQNRLREAITANENKTAFISNVSHEIRSPLNAILGFSEMLSDRELSVAERERYLAIIKNNGNDLLSILADIIDIAKLETGRLELKESEIDVNDFINDLETHFKGELLRLKKDIRLRWIIDKNLKGNSIITDALRLKQVLINLVINAIKFTEQGFIEIGIEKLNSKILFWVKDTGSGISENNLAYIFQRFRQVENSNNEISREKGFGLGLAISKALVNLLGGQIWVETVENKGSLFCFTIELKTENYMEMNAPENTNDGYPYNWKGRTILIAEDIDFSFLFMEAVLRRSGVKILWAQNGVDAVRLFKTNPDVEIVLMDIHMPVMNGYDATREIVKVRPDAIVIAQTAYVLPDEIRACHAAGCCGYLSKPVRKEQLLNTLSDYFEKIDASRIPYADKKKLSAG